MMVVMAVDWTVIGSHRLLHEDVPGSGSLGGAGESVPAGVHAVVALGAAGAAPVSTPAIPGGNSQLLSLLSLLPFVICMKISIISNRMHRCLALIQFQSICDLRK